MSVKLEVFTSQSCPYCPMAVAAAETGSVHTNSSTSSSIMLITLAENWKGSSAEIPSEMRQTPKMTAS